MHNYTPILLSKDGELTALANLDHLDKIQTVPLIRFLKDTNPTRVNNYINQRIKPLVNNWNFLENKIYLDVSDFDDNILLIQELVEKLVTGGVNIIPVLHPETPISVISIFKSHIHRGICLRFSHDTVNAPAIESLIKKSITNFDISIDQIDILIDFQYIKKDNISHYTNAFGFVYSQLTTGKQVRKILIGAGSFPPDLSAFADGTVTSVPRYEWDLWDRISKLQSDTTLVYADYGISHPVYNPTSENFQGTCSIKYTGIDSFHIFKGKKATAHPLGNGQYREKAESLMNCSFYSGDRFSWGDHQISKCALGEISPGSNAIWVKFHQNHHIAMVLNLLR